MSRRDPHSFSDLDQGRVQSLDLDLNVNFATSRIEGKATLNLAVSAGGPLDLDTRDLEIKSVSSPAGEDLGWEIATQDDILGSCLRVDLPEGTYTVRLVFAEPGSLKAGERVMNVSLQGEAVLTDLDIVTEAGGPRRMLRMPAGGLTRMWKKRVSTRLSVSRESCCR